MYASISLSANVAGIGAQVSQSRSGDGNAAINPSAAHAVAGVLSVRGSVSAGTISVYETEAALNLTDSDKAVLTWVDGTGALKHRYNVVCNVEDVGSSSSGDGAADQYTIAVSGGAGDDLPALASDIKIARQYSANITFDFDDVDTFLVTTNVRGVIVLMDSVELAKLVVDMAANGMGLWVKSTGFPAPASGTPITHVLYGSGDTVTTTSFSPVVAALYDATP